MSKRLEYIDFLKVIGLSLIIMAHVNPPEKIMMLRCFDVPLLVIISSILVSMSYEKSKNCILKFYIKRFKRLVFPTWIFLVLFFILLHFVYDKSYDFEYYKNSFLLTRYGISFVWIILIYIYSTLLIPLIDKMNKIKYNYLMIIVAYILFEFLYYKNIGINNRLFDTTFYYIIPYGCLTYLGYNFRKYNNNTKLFISTIFVIIYVILGIYYFNITGNFQSVQITKYPPRLYFLSYGISCSFFLLYFFEKSNFKIYKNRIIKFLSEHSLWIYLWHILVRFIYTESNLSQEWYIEYIIIYSLAIVITLIITIICNKINKEKRINFLKYIN